ncbi:hypothetical protein EV356DRAFT_457888, partial [Viridothelium virens]
LGKSWVTAYLTQYPNIITHVGCKLKARRTKYATKKEVIVFLTRYKDVKLHYNIQLKDIYNIDKQGISLSVCFNLKVLTSLKKKRIL